MKLTAAPGLGEKALHRTAPGVNALRVAALALCLTALSAVSAGAQEPPPRDYGESGVNTGVVRVAAGSGWLPVGSESGSGGGGSSCTTSSTNLIVEDDFRQPVNRNWRVFGPDGSTPFTASGSDLPASLPTYMRHFSPTGRWFAVSCDGNIQVLAEGGPPVNIAGLMQRALDQVDPPEPELAVTPETLHFTQLQSWLAIEPAYWAADRRATASAGRVNVTAIVTPIESVWDMGDGESVACTGPGTVWQAGLDPEAATCSYTYRQSSAGAYGDSFNISATVVFDVGLTTNAPGNYGPFPNIDRTTVDTIQVGEIQAVND